MVQLKQAVRLQPNYPGAHCYLGKALAALGRREEAVAELREALRLQPDYAEARQFLQTLVPNGEK